jgi:hypothetical protein
MEMPDDGSAGLAVCIQHNGIICAARSSSNAFASTVSVRVKLAKQLRRSA